MFDIGQALSGLSFDGQRFAREFLTRRIRRELCKFFVGIDPENLTWAVQHNLSLLSFLPPETLREFMAKSSKYREASQYFTDDEVYSWLPEETRALIEACPGGIPWKQQELKNLRAMFFGGGAPPS